MLQQQAGRQGSEQQGRGTLLLCRTTSIGPRPDRSESITGPTAKSRRRRSRTESDHTAHIPTNVRKRTDRHCAWPRRSFCRRWTAAKPRKPKCLTGKNNSLSQDRNASRAPPLSTNGSRWAAKSPIPDRTVRWPVSTGALYGRFPADFPQLPNIPPFVFHFAVPPGQKFSLSAYHTP